MCHEKRGPGRERCRRRRQDTNGVLNKPCDAGFRPAPSRVTPPRFDTTAEPDSAQGCLRAAEGTSFVQHIVCRRNSAKVA